MATAVEVPCHDPRSAMPCHGAKEASGRWDPAIIEGDKSTDIENLPALVQAAPYFAREASGEDRIAAFAPLEVEPDDNATRVLLQDDSGPIEVVISEHRSDPLLSMQRNGRRPRPHLPLTSVRPA